MDFGNTIRAAQATGPGEVPVLDENCLIPEAFIPKSATGGGIGSPWAPPHRLKASTLKETFTGCGLYQAPCISSTCQVTETGPMGSTSLFLARMVHSSQMVSVGAIPLTTSGMGQETTLQSTIGFPTNDPGVVS